MAILTLFSILLKKDVNTEAKIVNKTPIHIACYGSKLPIFKYLIEKVLIMTHTKCKFLFFMRVIINDVY